jgi:hypothetical protein
MAALTPPTGQFVPDPRASVQEAIDSEKRIVLELTKQPNGVLRVAQFSGEQFENLKLIEQIQKDYSRNLQNQTETPANLKSFIASLQTERDGVNLMKRSTQLHPSALEMPPSTLYLDLGTLSYSEKMLPIVSEVVQRSCDEIGGLCTLIEASMFYCVECLDSMISDYQQDKTICKKLQNLKVSFIHSAFSLVMMKQFRESSREGSKVTRAIYDFVSTFPLEEVECQKKELAACLTPKFEEAFFLFEYLLKSPDFVSCVWPTKRFPFPHKFMYEKVARFFEMELEGLMCQEKFSRKFPEDSVIETFKHFSALCSDTQGWLFLATQLASRRMSKVNLREPAFRKKRDGLPHINVPASIQLNDQISQFDKRPPYARNAATKDILYLFSSTNPVPGLLFWFNSKISRAIESIASKGLPDEYHFWFSQINVVRLEFLLDYVRSLFCGRQAYPDTVGQAKQVVQVLRQRCGQIDKVHAKALQDIFSFFLDRITQLKTAISRDCTELFKTKGIDQFLQENSCFISSWNPNLVLVDWLGIQFPAHEKLHHDLEAFRATQQAFTHSLRSFLKTKNLPQSSAQKILGAIRSYCYNSFFSPEHEALIIAQLYSRQWDLLMRDPRAEVEIPLA